jgi:hypothetical protein
VSVFIRPEPAAAAESRLEHFGHFKARLLSEGLSVEPETTLALDAKPALRVRSGSCGGLDLILPDGTWANAPIYEPFARYSPIRLVVGETGPELHEDGLPPIAVRTTSTPVYYNRLTTSGIPMRRVGQLCSDRVGFGLTNICTFWRSRRDRCRFCSIGNNGSQEQTRKALRDIVETAVAAIDDPVAAARHVLLGGGTPDVETSGILAVAEAAAAIKATRDVSVYAMVAPPRDLSLLATLREAGVDEVGMNIEVFSECAAQMYIPGKHRAHSVEGYLSALEKAVDLFGPVNTRSITVVGLEPADETIRGVHALAARGVMPILTPHRPLVGTQLAKHPRRSADELWELTLRAVDAAAEHGIPLGPTCIACQSNTLTVPGDARYRVY